MSSTSLLRTFGISVWRGLILIIGISFAFNLLLLALPIYSLQIFDRVLLSRSLDTLWVLTLGVTVALTTATILESLRGQLLLRISNRLALDFERRLFFEILERACRLGDRSLQPLRDLSSLRNFILTPQGLLALIDAPLIPLYLIGVFILHPWLGFAMAIGMVTLILTAWLADRFSTPLSKAVFEANQNAQRQLEELAHASDVVAANGIHEQAYRRWQSIQHRSLATASALSARSGQFIALAKGARLLLNVVLTGVGAYLAMNDQITMGAMIAASILSARGLAPLESLISASRQLVGAQLAYQRLADFLVEKTALIATRLPQPSGAIEVEKVIYIPPGASGPTIKGLSFQLAPGTFLGLVGPSAAGKSTLGRLLCGVWLPRSGAVRLDGAELQVWPSEDRGQACGYLPQDVQLLEGTVKENICRFSEARDEDVVAAAQAAGAHELIVRLPKGYETPVGPGGSALSAGQRQRIGLARAFFKNPCFVVLDEPNANLDSEGEQALNDCLALAKARGVTLIVISHRPSILTLADMLAVLVDGQLQQFGPKKEVLRRIQPHPAEVDRNVA